MTYTKIHKLFLKVTVTRENTCAGCGLCAGVDARFFVNHVEPMQVALQKNTTTEPQLDSAVITNQQIQSQQTHVPIDPNVALQQKIQFARAGDCCNKSRHGP